MKKLSIYAVVIIGLFVILFFLNQQAKQANDDETNAYGIIQSKLNPATVALLQNEHYQKIIVPKDLERKLKDDGGLFVYYFASNCPHCIYTTPKLMPMVDELQVDIHQYNLLEFTAGWDKYKIEFTPTLVYYKNGKEIDRMVGGLQETMNGEGYSLEDYRNFFIKYNTN